MADPRNHTRCVWVLPDELMHRIKLYQEPRGIKNQVEVARRLLDIGLQTVETVDDILGRLSDRASRFGDLRIAAGAVLASHLQVVSMEFDAKGVSFKLRSGETGRFDHIPEPRT